MTALRTTSAIFSNNAMIPIFSDLNVLAEKTEIDIAELDKIIADFDSPEDINDDPNTAPSKRIQALKNGYRKVAKGWVMVTIWWLFLNYKALK